MPVTRLEPETVEILLPSVKIWRDDIEDIFNWLDALSDASIDITVRCNDATYRLDTVAELKVRRIDSITMRESRVNVKVSLGYQNSIIAVDPSFQARATVEQIAQIARKHRRYAKLMLVIFTILGIPGAAALFAFASHSTIANLTSAALTLLAFAAFMPTLEPRSRTVTSLLYTSTRTEVPSFYRRKRDDLFINGVSLLVGGIIGYLINVIS